MKKSLKGILASVIAMVAFAPSVKAQVIELTQADFNKADVQDKGIAYDDQLGEYFLTSDCEYKITENITLPEGDSDIYIHDANVTIDATGYTFKGSLRFVDSNVTIVGGTFVGFNNGQYVGTRNYDALDFHNTNVVIKNGTFSAGYGGFALDFTDLVDGTDKFANNKNLTIENGTFASAYQTAVNVYGGNNIIIKNGTFTGTYAGLYLEFYKNASITRGDFRATYERNADDAEDSPYLYTGAIMIASTIDKNEIDKLLSENSAWDEDAEIKVYNEHFSETYGEWDEQAVYTQPEISVISKEERAEKDAKNKKTYKVLDGSKQEYDVNSANRLVFRFDIDYSVFKASGKVFMDGVEVDKANYETKEGSTIVAFTKEYTDTLKAGTHTIKVTTSEGEATAEFTVKKSEKEANPKTADNVIPYLVFAVISIGAVAVLVKNRRKIFNY